MLFVRTQGGYTTPVTRSKNTRRIQWPTITNANPATGNGAVPMLNYKRKSDVLTRNLLGAIAEMHILRLAEIVEFG